MVATSDPFETFMALMSSASESTTTTESSGPNGSEWCSDHEVDGARTQAGGL